MTPLTFTLKCDGLLDRIITQVGINQSQRFCLRQGMDRGPGGTCSAFWDTGASGSCVSRELAQKLGLQVVYQCQIIGIGGIQEANMYSIDIELPNGMTASNVLVSEFVDNGMFDVILGMDIITLGDFSVTNFNRESVFTFSCPPAPVPLGHTKPSSLPCPRR
jgi:hypothetical protein